MMIMFIVQERSNIVTCIRKNYSKNFYFILKKISLTFVNIKLMR